MPGFDLLGWIVLGFLAGSFSGWIVGTRSVQGCLPTIVVGILGGIVGGWLSREIGLGQVEGFVGALVLATIGGVIVRLVLRAIEGGREARRASSGLPIPPPVTSIEIEIHTGSRGGLFDLTRECARFVEGRGDGLLNVFVPHATCGLVVMELGAGSDADLMEALDRLLPRDDRWVHRHGSPGHGADHVVPAFAPPSVSIPVVGGRLALGTWQSIALLDTNVDNARRNVRLTFLAG